MADSYGGMNPYQYGFNSPALFNDPWGDTPNCPTCEENNEVLHTARDAYNSSAGAYNDQYRETMRNHGRIGDDDLFPMFGTPAASEGWGGPTYDEWLDKQKSNSWFNLVVSILTNPQAVADRYTGRTYAVGYEEYGHYWTATDYYINLLFTRNHGGTANVSNVADAGIHALAGYDNLIVTGNALDKLVKSPATAALDADLINKAKADPNFGTTDLSFKFKQVVEYGGQRAPGNMQDQLLGFWKSEYRPTWKVAANELTWLVRHATVSGWVKVKASGEITIQHNLYDILDLRPGSAERGIYNQVTYYLGTGWHDILGASEPTINASWKSNY